MKCKKKMKHCIIPPSALPRPHMKGSLCFPEMLDNSDSPRVLTNSIMGHFESISAPFFFLPHPPLLCTACQAAGFFWCEYKMFYFRRAESCSLWLITHHFPTATVSGSPLPLQQTHKKKKLAEFTWSRQVKSNMSVIVSRCGTGHWCEVSVCVRLC